MMNDVIKHTLQAQTPKSMLLTALFAVMMILLGLGMDILSLSLFRKRKDTLKGGHPGLPLVPWMIYFLASVFWWMRGWLPVAVVSLIVLTFWHAYVFRTIYRSGSQLPHRNI